MRRLQQLGDDRGASTSDELVVVKFMAVVMICLYLLAILSLRIDWMSNSM